MNFDMDRFYKNASIIWICLENFPKINKIKIIVSEHTK